MRHRNRRSPAPVGRCRALGRSGIEFTGTSENRETRPHLQDQESIPHPIPTSDSLFTAASPLARATRPNSNRQLIVELLDYSLWISAADVEFLRSIRWSSRLSSQQMSELTEIVDAFAIGKPRTTLPPFATKR
jgi:hypothetical protein